MKLKRTIFLNILLLMIGSSCYHEWEMRPQIEGFVYSFDTKRPINATVYFLPVDGETFVDTSKVNANGKFVFNKKSAKYWTITGMEKPESPPLSNQIVISCKGFINDTIDYSETEWHDNSVVIDNVFLKSKKN